MKWKTCSRGHKYQGSGPCPQCWPGYAQKKTRKSLPFSKEVDAYIAKAPKEIQQKLRELRKAIKQVAPDAEEKISYRMPFYSYKGRLAWFAAMKTHIGLYLRPPVIEEYKDDLVVYTTTKSAIHFPLDKKLPVSLIKKLVRARMKMNEAGK